MILKNISSAPDVSLYELVDEEFQRVNIRRDEPHIHQKITPHLYVASAEQIRRVLTKPQIVSPAFEKKIQQGIGAIISRTPLSEILNESFNGSHQADLLYIMRGGLNFDPKIGLSQIGKFPIEHYLSSQRKRVLQEKGEDTWEVTGTYKKMFENESTPREVNLVFGDIVASGSSLENGLTVFLEEMKNLEHQLNSLTFFSIGGGNTQEKIRDVLRVYQQELTSNFRANVIYLEGRFGLATKQTPLPIKVTGTDLLTYHENAVISPELVLSLLNKPEHILEECVVYDGGKRRSSRDAHFTEVIEYWDKLKQLAEEGLTLHQAINERYPILDINSISELRKLHPYWQDTPDWVLKDILDRKESQLASIPNTADALLDICNARKIILEENKTGQTYVKLSGDKTHHIGLTKDFFEGINTVFFGGEPARIDAIYDALDVQQRRIKTGRGLPVVRGYTLLKSGGEYHKVLVAAIASGMGLGSMEIIEMETLQKLVLEANVCKTVNFIRIGTSGTHQHKFVHGGDLIIADRVHAPFGTVDDVIVTSHMDPEYHLKLSMLTGLRRVIEAELNPNKINEYFFRQKDVVDKKIIMNGYQITQYLEDPLSKKINQIVKEQIYPQDLNELPNSLTQIDRLIAEMEVLEVYPCDQDIVKYCLMATKDMIPLGGGKIYQGGLFSKQTLASECWDDFDMDPDSARGKILEQRKKVLTKANVYCSEMELAMMTSLAHCANKENNVRVGGIMAIVNNPRNPDRSENNLFADPFTIARAVESGIDVGLRVARVIYQKEVLEAI